MTVIMIIFAAMFAVGFYFINKLINQYTDLNWRVDQLESDLNNCKYEINDLYSRFEGIRVDVDELKLDINQEISNVDACANSILKMRNEIGKIGNKLQAIERKETE